MNLKQLKDRELLIQTQKLVGEERHLLTQVLHHLRKIERRRLFCDLGYQSLFEYTVKELKYSEGQAGRRIQAMRLITEIPEVEEKINSGRLTLTNISQAQSFFRDIKKQDGDNPVNSRSLHPNEDPLQLKRVILKNLEDKSSREGQKLLLRLQPHAPLPKERERPITHNHTEIKFVVDQKLKNKLNELRSLLGYKGHSMDLAEIVDFMTDIAIEQMKTKKFGKKRVQQAPKTLKPNRH